MSQASNQLTGLDWERTRFHDYPGDPRNLKGHIQHGDILINSTGRGTLGRVGRFTGCPDNKPCIADTHVTVARVDRSAWDERFAFYYLGSSLFSDYMNSNLVVGSTNQIELSNDGLSNSPGIMPPLDEQWRISDFLDAETGRIDRLIFLREQQFSALTERASAEVSERFFPGILASPLGDYPWRWLPKLDSSTPLVRLGYVCRIQGGVTLDGTREIDDKSVTRPYLRVANVQADHVDLSSVSEITVPLPVAARSALRPGDVLMTEGGDIDKLGRGTVWRGEIPGALHQNHIFALRPDKNRLDPEYLALLTQSLHGRCYFESTGVRSTNLASTNSTKVLAFPIPLPKLSRQRELIAIVHKSLGSTREAKDGIERQISLLAERRQALITAAVTGQMDVTTAGRAAVG
ncbi:restriction endonuclease subunit S [Allosalinactinospora lopnorensis]|uniref:restriction endonuclease subunit S n=1 Tax=Allosalinactinospora lopnorensis TaxID=1352348 RepID=UPI00138EEDF8|nr:restriction endonuclease subunit S [Allosalinactinospora lopnorensis]